MYSPITGDELIAIGNKVNDVVERLRMMENGTEEAGLMDGVWDVSVDIANEDLLVGQVRYHPDGWWAFYPRGVAE